MPDTARNVIPSEAPALSAVDGRKFSPLTGMLPTMKRAQKTLDGKTLHTGKSTSEFLKGELQVPEKI